MRIAQQEHFIKQLEIFKQRLLKIDASNQSIFLRRIVKKRAFDCIHIDPKLRERCWHSIHKGKGEVTIFPEVESGTQVEIARASLKELYRFWDSLKEEKGLDELYLGFCWLEGNLDLNTFIRAPLALVPIKLWHKLEGKQQGWVISISNEQPIISNRTLLALLRKVKGLKIDADKFDDDLRNIFDNGATASQSQNLEQSLFYRCSEIITSQYELPFSIDEPTDTIIAIQPLNKSDLAARSDFPVTFRNYAVIGIFPQASGALFNDVEEMIKRAKSGETDQGIVDNLLDAPADDTKSNSGDMPSMNRSFFNSTRDIFNSDVNLDQVPADSINTVLPSDPSQDEVIVKAQKADCVVVRGPPGTGKSQLIANLVADGASRGWRILVCCQKRAALDVVYHRLESAGLGDIAFLVHDGKSDQPELYKKIKNSLERNFSSDKVSGTNLTENISSNDRRLKYINHRIDSLVEKIKNLIEPFSKEFHGRKLRDLYSLAEKRYKHRLDVPEKIIQLDYNSLQEILELIRKLQPGILSYNIRYPIKRRNPWDKVSHIERDKFIESLKTIERLTEETSNQFIAHSDIDYHTYRNKIENYLQLYKKWYRIFLPRWHSAKTFIGKHYYNFFKTIQITLWKETIENSFKVYSELISLNKCLKKSLLGELNELRKQPAKFLEIIREIRQYLENEFTAIQQHDRYRNELTDATKELIKICYQGLKDTDEWSKYIEQDVILRWIDEAETAYPQIRGNPLAEYENARKELRKALEEKNALVLNKIRESVRNMHLSLYNSQSRPKLLHQVGKQRRIWPLRKIVSEYGGDLNSIVPCWLVSPEVVSEIFPLEKGFFDLVIFDEASQMDLERALPTLYRAKRVVIAGDEQQMPPSHWFDAVADDEDEESEDGLRQYEATKEDSLLMAAKRIYGFNYLSWHYRSKYQELIDFSNHAYYEGKLNVAANITHSPQEPSIQWHRVNGVWDDQFNPVEVRECVKILHKHLQYCKQRKWESIGILAFNAKQMDKIKDEIEQTKKSNGEFAELWNNAQKRELLDERPFVKNLENIQGDERDVIVISVGYGEGPDGNFRRRFGILNREGGENYLNVAVTRAKKGIHIVCSFDPEFLSVENSKNIGPLRLKQYLTFAKAVSSYDKEQMIKIIHDVNPSTSRISVARQPRFDSPFEEEVFDALRNKGYKVEPQVGLGGYRIDLAIVDPNNPHKYLLGIECDGATFHSGRSVRERDVARQEFLESRGWKIVRIWSRNWWQDKECEIKRVIEAINP
ncbi:MAG: hypothetical protein Kow0090_11040 [Myxococcota bacterium]